MASPHFDDLSGRVPLDAHRPRPETIEIRAGRIDVELVLFGDPSDEVRSSGYIHGFGLPTNTVKELWECRESPVPTLTFRVVERGWFPDIDGVATIELPRRGVKKVVVRVEQGNIIVTRRAAQADLPELDLETREGRVQR